MKILNWSKKLTAFLVAAAVVIVPDVVGHPLAPDTLGYMSTLVIAYLSAQGSADLIKRFKEARKAAEE